MELKEGYKNTEVGVIPNDWTVSTISDVGKIDPENLGSKTPLDYEFKYISLEDIDRGKILGHSQIKFAEAPSRARRVLRQNDVVFGTVRPNLQSHFFVSNEGSDLICSTGFAVIRPNLETHSASLIFHILFSGNIERQLNAILVGSNYPAVNSKDVKALKIPLPTSLKEQQTIATALSDIDTLIANLDKLIAKKKAIKQGAMQQLLKAPDKGGKRLPEFEGEWVETTIGQIARISTGSKNTQDRVEDGKYPFFVRSQIVERINTYSFEGEGILTAGDGVGTGKVFHYVNERIDIHQRVYLISDFKPSIDGYFLFLIFKENFYDRIMSMTAKSSVDSVRKEMITGMSISVPPTKEEQQEIASILLDMDTEIEKLESKKSKYLRIKQGMMQELLTGKTRLI